MNKLVLLLTCFLLIGCAKETPVITSQKFVVVEVPANLFECPVVTKFPNYNTLTDVEVAQLLKTLYKYNLKCKNNIEAIEQYLSDSKARIEKE